MVTMGIAFSNVCLWVFISTLPLTCLWNLWDSVMLLLCVWFSSSLAPHCNADNTNPCWKEKRKAMELVVEEDSLIEYWITYYNKLLFSSYCALKWYIATRHEKSTWNFAFWINSICRLAFWWRTCEAMIVNFGWHQLSL